MNPKLVFSVVLPLLLCFLQSGSVEAATEVTTPLHCHQCSTYKDSQCDDPFFENSQGEKKDNVQFLKPCKEEGAKFCRKIWQNVRGDVRIIRSCAWEINKENNTNNCYKTVLEEYNTLVCQCFGSGCNTSSMLSMSVTAILSAVVLAVLLH
jgi:hypothetical protein